MLFIVAAGNDGDAHYISTFTDEDGDGWHDFAPGEPGLKVGVGSVLDVVMRWDAWTGTAVNLDLYIFSGDGSQLLASSRNVQGTGGQKEPVEKIGIPLRREFQGQTFLIGIRAIGEAPPITVEIFTKNSELELFTPVGSVATPGDAKGAFTVGATNFKNGNLESFSSQGPTIDKRQKPDITGPDRVTTAAYTKENPRNPAFPGTSAACPHVSGAAALVFSLLGDGATPDQVQQFLVSRALDIEDPGADNKTGAGDLRLGEPSADQGNAPPSAAPRTSARPASSARPSSRRARRRDPRPHRSTVVPSWPSRPAPDRPGRSSPSRAPASRRMPISGRDPERRRHGDRQWRTFGRGGWFGPDRLRLDGR